MSVSETLLTQKFLNSLCSDIEIFVYVFRNGHLDFYQKRLKEWQLSPIPGGPEF